MESSVYNHLNEQYALTHTYTHTHTHTHTASQVLQSMGNIMMEMDAKEPFMQPMSATLPGGVLKVKEFIQDLVQIDQRNSE